MTQSRWRSPVLWGAVVSQVVAIAIALKVIDLGLGDQINQIAMLVCQLMVTLGVFNDPKDPVKF